MKNKLTDYHKVRKIGQGSFGEITEVELTENYQSRYFAMKQLSQKQLFQLQKLHEPLIEKQILLKFNKIYPQGFVNLFETQSDEGNIYLILQLCEGGSLEKLIHKIKGFENREEVLKIIIAKMVLILETMHKHGVVHRDLKPSNFLLTKDGQMKLADFGTAYAPFEFFGQEAGKQILHFKQLSKEKKNEKMSQDDLEMEQYSQVRRATFVGTPLYMAPQLLAEDCCGTEADLWALGCIIYELIHCKTPFHDENEGKVWKKILNEDYKGALQTGKQSEFELQCQFLISALLIKQREKRLGYGQNGYQQLKGHSFFKGINWEKIKTEPIKQLADFFEEEEMLKSIQSTQSKLSEEQKIIFSGVVEKKMFFGNYKERMLVLNSSPKLLYYDTETGEKKGEINLHKDIPIGSQGNKIFTVTNQKKTFYFKSAKAAQWIQMLKYAVINAYY